MCRAAEEVRRGVFCSSAVGAEVGVGDADPESVRVQALTESGPELSQCGSIASGEAFLRGVYLQGRAHEDAIRCAGTDGA